jgi:hypothetical protein
VLNLAVALDFSELESDPKSPEAQRGTKWSDVDFEQSKLYVRRSVWRGQEQTPKAEGAYARNICSMD